MEGPTNMPRNVLNFLFQRERYVPISDNLCSHLGIAEIIALTRTCKALAGLYQELLPRLWDVDKSLSRFFKDTTNLRSEMARTEALISGSFALQFLERIELQRTELEIYMGDAFLNSDQSIPPEAWARFLEDEGYVHQEELKRNQDYDGLDIVILSV